MFTTTVRDQIFGPAVGVLRRNLHWTRQLQSPTESIYEFDNMSGKARRPLQDKGFVWAPFPRVANCRKFKVTIGELDSVYDAYGIKKRESAKFEFESANNKAFVRYAKFSIIRLRSTKSDRLFWLRAKVILERSVVFAMMSVSKSFDRYHRELPLHLVMKWVFGYFEIMKKRSINLDFTRVYIPKPNGKKRPLGVPKPVWRLAMSTMLWILITRFGSSIPDTQHAYMPGRGTLTAFKEVMLNVRPSKYIYEFDLRGFFDNVPVTPTLDFMKERGLPQEWWDWLFLLTFQEPVFKGIQPKDVIPGEKSLCMPEVTDWYLEMREMMYAEIDSLRDDEYRKKGGGFPQGANLSPFLSILSLNIRGQPTFARLLMYADDGIFYSDEPFTEEQVVEHFRALGQEVALDKSGWICQGGVATKDIKFLGMEYSYEHDEWSSNTRAGKRLIFDKFELIRALEERERLGRYKLPAHVAVPDFEGGDGWTSWGRYAGEYYLHNTLTGEGTAFPNRAWARQEKARLEEESGSTLYNWKIGRISPDGELLVSDIEASSSWEDVMKSRAMGLLQSRMFSGEWNQSVDQDFSLSAIGKSWVSVRGKKSIPLGVELDFANSTTYAFCDIVSLIKKSRRNRWAKNEYRRGRIDLDTLNALRRGLGLPPLAATLYRSIRVESAAAQPKAPESEWSCISALELQIMNQARNDWKENPVETPDWLKPVNWDPTKKK